MKQLLVAMAAVVLLSGSADADVYVPLVVTGSNDTAITLDVSRTVALITVSGSLANRTDGALRDVRLVVAFYSDGTPGQVLLIPIRDELAPGNRAVFEVSTGTPARWSDAEMELVWRVVR